MNGQRSLAGTAARASGNPAADFVLCGAPDLNEEASRTSTRHLGDVLCRPAASIPAGDLVMRGSASMQVLSALDCASDTVA